MTAKRKPPVSPKPTVYDLLIREVIPRLKLVEGEVQTVKGDVANLKGDVADVRKEVHDAGLGNGHSDLLKSFLEDQAAKKKRGQAYAAVGNDIRGRFQFLVRPRQFIARAAVFLVAAIFTGYSSAVFLGKASIPTLTWPFHH